MRVGSTRMAVKPAISKQLLTLDKLTDTVAPQYLVGNRKIRTIFELC